MTRFPGEPGTTVFTEILMSSTIQSVAMISFTVMMGMIISMEAPVMMPLVGAQVRIASVAA
mgnify:CR=1 FL=1